MKKTLIGIVVSNSQAKTLRVEIERRMKHPKYGKIIRGRTVCHVHDEHGDASKGDTVEIAESPPRSRLKRWDLVRVVSAAVASEGPGIPYPSAAGMRGPSLQFGAQPTGGSVPVEIDRNFAGQVPATRQSLLEMLFNAVKLEPQLMRYRNSIFVTIPPNSKIVRLTPLLDFCSMHDVTGDINVESSAPASPQAIAEKFAELGATPPHKIWMLKKSKANLTQLSVQSTGISK